MRFKEVSKLLKLFPKYLIVTGSYVRRHPIINDIDFLTLKPINYVMKAMFNRFHKVKIISSGKNKVFFSIYLPNRIKPITINIWHVPNKHLMPYYKLEYNSGMNIIHIKREARKKGFKLSIKGLQNLKTKEFVKGLTTPLKILKYINLLP